MQINLKTAPMNISFTQDSPLGEWVDQLLNTVFFQPDDDLSSNAIQEFFSRDLKVRYGSLL